MAENTQFIPSSTNTPLRPIPADKLKKLAMKGGVWTSLGFGAKQILRFGNNLIITRLLFPELLGIMALVNAFILGLTFFSDIGLNLNIIQSKRGDDPTFLNTAWTIQVIRGFVLALAALLIAWPASQFYDEPLLLYAIPLTSLTAVFQGFNSTKKATANRELRMRELTLIELGSYVFGISIMIGWAYFSPTIWALVVGTIAIYFAEMILTHIALPGHTPRFQLDRGSIGELYRFGRWIFVSSALTFLTTQSDRFIIGKLVSTHFLGIYLIAAMFAQLVQQAVRELGYRVLLPSYSSIERDNPENLYKVLRQSRLILIGLNWLAALTFVAFAHLIVQLWDNRYAEAGWMLQILAIGTLVGVLGITYDNVLVAKGKTSALAALSTIQLIIQVSAMLIGATYWGELGVIVGLACVGWLIYPFKALWLARLSLWQPEVDLPVISVASVLVLALLYLF